MSIVFIVGLDLASGAAINWNVLISAWYAVSRRAIWVVVVARPW